MPPPLSLLVPVLKLRLLPAMDALVYDVTLTWETFANGEYQCSTIHKTICLRVQPNPAGYVVDFQTLAPTLTKPEDLESLEEVALRLAALYERVLVQVTPTGEVVGLLNHGALLQTWQRIAQDLRAATTDEDQVTETLLGYLEQQLQSPAHFLNSLRHDYVYQTLLPDFYQLPGTKHPTPKPVRRFSNFFDKTALCFSEHRQLLPNDDPARTILFLSGRLDEQRTDLPAVRCQIEKALGMARAPAGTPPQPPEAPAPQFHYAATYVLETSTGLPISVALSVYARAGQLFNKEYTLVITRP